MVDLSYLVADKDYYAPSDELDPGPRYHAGPMPAGWSSHDSGLWTHWAPPDPVLVDTGWKVHVSSSLANAQSVLTLVAAACAEAGIQFKHLAGRRTFLLLHSKHGPRVQAGKFCALYPRSADDARALMQRLERDLAGISGPYVLTDRRFGSSECVFYRYGSFRHRSRTDGDGYRVPTVLLPDGRELADERKPRFQLPPGITDPFGEETPVAKAKSPVTLGSYRFQKVLQHSNAGGAYRFSDGQDQPVFLKEARSHNGYTDEGADAKARLSGEYLNLRAIHTKQPGLCPRPIELFQHWEHSYLATEWVEGNSLFHWMISNNPALDVNPTEALLADYYRRSLGILDQLQEQLDRLHEIGFVFVDLSPNNVFVTDDDRVRLIDFEAAQPVRAVRSVLGTPGYQHPDARAVAEHDPLELDRYGLAALALVLLSPIHEVAHRHPPVLDHLHADLSEFAPIPQRLWQWATSNREPAEERLPGPHAVRDDTVAALHQLAEQTADGLQAMASPEHRLRVYPTTATGYQTNTRSLAFGTAGVLAALHRAGRSCDPAVVRRLRDEALATAETSAPGLMFGTAGIACVLAELGEVTAAETLFTVAAKHPLNHTSASLGGGAAGTAIGLLIQHRRTGEQQWLELADQVLARLPEGSGELEVQLSPTAPSGLVGGRPGIALALYYLYRRTGNPQLFARGMELLRTEFVYAELKPEQGLRFRPAARDPRVLPYLYAGSAGYAAVLSRYLAHRPDAEFVGPAPFSASEALERCLQTCSIRFAALSGLFTGLAGLAVTLAGAGRRLNRPELVEAALASGRGLFRYAIPSEDGVTWLGEPGLRLSAELWSGSAGVLWALRQLTDPAPFALDLLDDPA